MGALEDTATAAVGRGGYGVWTQSPYPNLGGSRQGDGWGLIRITTITLDVWVQANENTEDIHKNEFVYRSVWITTEISDFPVLAPTLE